MYVWELHEALARSLNDPYMDYADNYIYAPIVGTNDPRFTLEVDMFCGDGMRYSAMQRSMYLDRAIMSIIRDAMMQVMHLPRVQASAILQKLFPALTEMYSNDFVSEWQYEHFWVYSIIISVKGVYAKEHSPRARSINTFGDSEYIDINVPIMTEVEAKNLFGVQSKIRPDLIAYCVWKPNRIAFYGERLADLKSSYADNKMHITFMKKPKKITELGDNELVEFDDIYFDNIIQRATLYGLHDSGLLGSANLAMPLLDLPTIKVGSYIPQVNRGEEQ